MVAKQNLALPLGELSPQVTERVSRAGLVLSASISPEAAARDVLALPLGELSPQVTERVKRIGSAEIKGPFLGGGCRGRRP